MLRGVKRTTRLGWSLASLAVAQLTACGGAVKGSEPAGAAGDSAAAGTKTSEGTAGKGSKPQPGNGGAATGSGGAATGGVEPVAGAGGAAGIDACASKQGQPPGEPVYDEMTVGRGECVAVSLAQVLRAIEALRPDLNDVTTLYAPDPERGGDGSFRYAFLRPNGGFAVVFKRGDGDCPSGCIINDYWYFEAGVDCEVQEVGETHRGGDGCIQADQLPRWGIPRSALPSEICDADLSPQDLSGSYLIPTCGQASSSCLMDKEKGASQPLPGSIMLSIAQDPADLSRGLIYLNDTQQPGIDGVPFAATFERMKVTAFVETSNLPSNCLEQSLLQFEYDFEGSGRRLSFNSSSSPDCANAPSN
jgi:hypothetical protein